MMKNRSSLHIGIILLLTVSCLPSSLIANDTLYLKSYVDVVYKNHPLIQKANVFDEVAVGYQLEGRGALDPKINSDFQNKFFEDKNYFNNWYTEAKIPTSLPIDFALGYERNDGLFLNPENSVPSNGLVYATVDITLLRGLLFDEQRYALRGADLKSAKSQIDKESLVREVIFQAINTYLTWAKAYNNNQIYENYLELIQVRHQNVIELYVNGDIPAVDTLESRVNLNSAQKLLLESQKALIKEAQRLSLFIWDDEGNPLAMTATVIPETIQSILQKIEAFNQGLEPIFANDLKIQKIQNEIQAIELKNRLDREQLKPQLNLKYNTVVNMGQSDVNPTFSLNDYKYGVGVNIPILNRKSRGKIKLNEAFIKQNQFDRTQGIAQLRNKYQGLILNLEVQSSAIVVSQEKVVNSESLYEAEQLKFSLGESSIFLLNQRERKLLEAQVELLSTNTGLGLLLNELYYFQLGQS